MWIYRLAHDIDSLNSYAEEGYDFVCTRRHRNRYDEYLVRKWEGDQASLEAPFYPVKKEWVIPMPGRAG